MHYSFAAIIATYAALLCFLPSTASAYDCDISECSCVNHQADKILHEAQVYNQSMVAEAKYTCGHVYASDQQSCFERTKRLLKFHGKKVDASINKMVADATAAMKAQGRTFSCSLNTKE